MVSKQRVVMGHAAFPGSSNGVKTELSVLAGVILIVTAGI